MPRTGRRISIAMSLALMAAGGLLVAAAPAAQAATTDIRINEVESNGDTRDWVELTNVGSTPVDVGGWIVKDDTDTRTLAIPAGTTIAPGAYLAIDTDNPSTAGNFGLGGNDKARIYLPDGTTLIDSYAWTTHAAVTYGRCPNGTGDFGSTTVSTKGAANNCSAPNTAVKINEVESNGDTRDWIELYNTGTGPVDISGWILKDNDNTRTYAVPAGTTLAAGSYATFDVDDPAAAGNFGLGGADSARVYLADGTTLIDSYTWTAHAITTYGRCPNGTGEFATTAASTKNAANSCAPATPSVSINEIESNGDQVADWVELRNNGAAPVNVSGWKILDNDPSHAAAPVVIPANTSIPAGGYYAIYTEFGQSPGFGLGGADSVTLLLPDGTTQVDSYAWTVHAATTYGRCPDGTGAFTTTTTSTRGLPNACSPVRINEIESSGGVPGDWIELKNIGAASVDLSGWRVADSGATYTIPAGTSIAGGGYLVLDEADLGFGLGGADSVTLFGPTGPAIESYSWTVAAAQTYGRCKDGVGTFVDTKAPTKGTANSCPGLDTLPWPGGQSVSVADRPETFVQDLSGLAFDPSNPDVLWAAQNKKGTLFKLVRDAENNWVPAQGWPKDPKFAATPNAVNGPDSEGITIGPDGFVYLASERDNDASGVSRMSVLRYDPASTGSTITPTGEWLLNSKLPSVGANLGLEGITWVPDSYLVAGGFVDQSTNQPYDPSRYPLHGTGLYVVAVEATGKLYAFALDSDGSTSHLIATIDSGFSALADVSYDPELKRLRAVTDDTVDGKTSLLKLDAQGSFVVDVAYDRPAGMPNLNNEGLAIAPRSRCVDGVKEAIWADDGDTDGHSLRRGTINCAPLVAQQVSFTSAAPTAAVVGDRYTPQVTGGGSGNAVIVAVAEGSTGVCSLNGSEVRFDHPGTCVLRAVQTGSEDFLGGSAEQSITVAKAPQTITFAQPGNTVFGGASVALTASSSVNLPVTLTSETPAVCSVVAARAVPLAPGTCRIVATQPGNADYLPASPVTRTLTVAKAGLVVSTKATSGLFSLLTFRVKYTTTVTSAVTGRPVAGLSVTTKIDQGSKATGCTAVTDAKGVAICSAGPINIASGVPFTVSVPESANYLAGRGTGRISLF